MTKLLNEDFETDILLDYLSDVQKVVKLEIFEGSLSKFEKLLYLPKKMSSKKCVTTENHWWGFEYRYRKDYRDVAYRILKNNIGKNFDNAFSYYCKQVPKRYHKVFLEYFERFYFRVPIWKVYQEYFVDESGNIQFDKNFYYRKRDKKFVSWNAEYKDFDVVSNSFKHSDKYWYYYNLQNKNKRPIFQKRLIKGFEKEFETKNCKEYKKLKSEDTKSKRKFERKEKQRKAKIDWNKLMSSFEANKKAAEKNRIDIERLGFDEKTSFTQK